jgi:hypothetical protein
MTKPAGDQEAHEPADGLSDGVTDSRSLESPSLQGAALESDAVDSEAHLPTAAVTPLGAVATTVLRGLLGQVRQPSEQDGGSSSALWNAYLFVIGTDRKGADFNRMRELLMAESDYVEPWVVATYDFKRGEIRKAWKPVGAAARQERFSLGDFSVVYADIERLSAFGRVRELHFLTHASSQYLEYQPHRTTTWTDLARLGPDFAMAFSADAVVKVHGCSHDEALSVPVRDFCDSGSDGASVVRDVRRAMGYSYAVALARASGVPVWAAPLGAGAFFSCSYLRPGEHGKRFCVEIDAASNPDAEIRDLNLSWGYLVRFYETNYELIFPRAAGERVFDGTFHMKYRGTLTLGGQTPRPCAAASRLTP